jgi:hypothetical protein
VEYDKLSERWLGEPSECIRARVEAARERQRERFSQVSVNSSKPENILFCFYIEWNIAVEGGVKVIVFGIICIV